MKNKRENTLPVLFRSDSKKNIGTYVFHSTCIASGIGAGLEALVVSVQRLCIVVGDIELVLPGGLAVGQVPPLYIVVLAPALIALAGKDPVALHVAQQKLAAHLCTHKTNGNNYQPGSCCINRYLTLWKTYNSRENSINKLI